MGDPRRQASAVRALKVGRYQQDRLSSVFIRADHLRLGVVENKA